jgi:hypothetical protein
MEKKPEQYLANWFVNEHSMVQKRIKVRAFNLFHRCELKCYKNTKGGESEVFSCDQDCRTSRA